MTQPVQGPDGNLYQFPDGTTQDAAISYFKKNGIGVKAQTFAPPPGTPTVQKPAAPPMSQVRTLTGTPYNPDSLEGRVAGMEGDAITSAGHMAAMTPVTLHRLLQKYGIVNSGDVFPGEHTLQQIKEQDVPNAVLTIVGGFDEEAPAALKDQRSPVAKMITDAVNPNPKLMPKYESELANHMDKIVATAFRKGLPIDSPETLGAAMKATADTIKAHYYDRILGPFKNNPVDTTSIPGYSGESLSPSTATLGQLDARLSQINAELDPKFRKPGEIQAQAAVKSSGDLNAESSAIRQIYYKNLGQVSGIDPKVLAQTRQAFGSIRQLAQTTTESATMSRFMANKTAQEPLTLNPLSKTKNFVADKALQKMQGNPAQNAIRKAIKRGGFKRYQLPEPNPAAASQSRFTSTARTPVRGGSTPAGRIVTTSPEEAAAHVARLEERVRGVLESRNKTIRRPIWENPEDYAKKP